MTPKLTLLAYFVAINLFALMVFWLDKRRETLHQERIPGRVLLVFVALGGTFGAWRAMQLYRHKRKNSAFQNQFRLITIIQILLIGYLIYRNTPPEILDLIKDRIN
jgi:uncharacterized membrane protein YsdA (DUF1294 family)